MHNEVERKFFVAEIPDISGINPLVYERYILKHEKGEEERITKVGDKYFYEKKKEISNLERKRYKREITKEKFMKLKQRSTCFITRDRYDISSNPKISIQIYHGKYEGLVRAEIEFHSNKEAEDFKPPKWMGKEITNLPIARDAKLSELTEEEFKKIISK